MGMRILSGILWFVVVGYLWNLVALVAGVSDAPAIVLGLAAAFLFAGDPLHRIWTRGTADAEAVPAQPAQAPQPV